MNLRDFIVSRSNRACKGGRRNRNQIKSIWGLSSLSVTRSNLSVTEEEDQIKWSEKWSRGEFIISVRNRVRKRERGVWTLSRREWWRQIQIQTSPCPRNIIQSPSYHQSTLCKHTPMLPPPLTLVKGYFWLRGLSIPVGDCTHLNVLICEKLNIFSDQPPPGRKETSLKYFLKLKFSSDPTFEVPTSLAVNDWWWFYENKEDFSGVS